MAKKKKVTKEEGTWFEPYMANYPPTITPDWVEPELPEKEPAVPEVLNEVKERRVVLIGNYLHSVGINGTVRKYKGGEPITVEENIYHILKDADLIREEL